MGIFNAISGTPTSANTHSSTTILWYGCFTPDSRLIHHYWLIKLPASQEETIKYLITTWSPHPSFIVHAMSWKTWCRSFLLVSYGDSDITFDFQTWRTMILFPDLGHLSFCIVYFILYKTGKANVLTQQMCIQYCDNMINCSGVLHSQGML